MRPITVLTILLCLWLCGCENNKTDEIDCRPTTTVSLQILPDEITQITRTTDDKTIEDVNLFFYFPSGELALHLYSNTTQLRFTSPIGSFTLAVAANVGCDMGKLSLDELDAFALIHSDNYEYLPMCYRGQIDVQPNAGTVTLPAVTVSWSVARIEYNIMLIPELADYTLTALQLVNIPKTCRVFDTTATPSPDSKDYFIGETKMLAGRNTSGAVYLFANKQGVKPGITDQRQKNPANAPVNATFLRVTAMKHNGTVISCNVYLGENNTSDFNVRANASYAMNINILGDNLTDTRISKYAYSVTNDFMASNYYGGYCLSGERHVNVSFSSDSRNYSFTGHFSALVPPSDVTFDDANIADFIVPYANPSGMYSYAVDYRPGIFNTENSAFKFSVEIADEYAFTRKFTTTIPFANGVKAYFQRNLGAITATDAIGTYILRGEDPGQVVLCWEKGCTLKITPVEGYSFDGWYADAAFTNRLSATPELKYVPTKPLDALYPKFSTMSVAIYTDVDTVELKCNKPYTIDSARKAFIVPKNSECTISGKYASYIANWYDSYDLETRKWLGFNVPYTFIATEDRTIAPGYRVENRLDENGTANCYIFPMEYGLYSFDATIQGNGKTTKDITPQRIAGGVRVVELWYTDIFSPIVQLAYRDGRIYFLCSTNRQSSNCIVGLLDAKGNLLWSWHLWRSVDPNKSAVTYPDGRTFMSKNLGSTGATSNGQEATVSGFGFYYQWGRKDPFPYPNRYSETKPTQQAHYINGYFLSQVNSSSATTMAWATAHPTTFINGTDAWKDWLPAHNLNLWGNQASTSSHIGTKSSKTIYDPCPPGWKVPDESAWTDAAFYIDRFYTIGYFYLATSYMDQHFHPAGGYFLNGAFTGLQMSAYYWKDSPARSGAANTYITNEGCAMIVNKDKTMSRKYGGLRRDAGAMVRCMKE